MTFGALFAGIGGIDLGLERAGFVCRWQIEIDPFCNRVLEKHWPGVKRYGDIRTVTGDELEPVDLMCGGFPCQDLSQAGKRAGIEGARSGLWFEFARLIGVVRPRYVLIENVAGLLIYDGIRRVIGELARLRYVGLWRSLRASEFRAAHLRKRVFIVAYRQGERTTAPTNGRTQYQSDDRRRIPGWTGTNSEDLADAATTRPDGSPRQELCVRGPSLQPARFDNGGGSLENAGYSGIRRTKEPPELDRERPSDHYCGTSRTLADRQCFAGTPIDADAGNRRQDSSRGSEQLGESDSTGLSQQRRPLAVEPEYRSVECGSNAPLQFAPGPADPRWPAILRTRPDLAPAIESPIRGMVDGFPDWLDGALSNRTKRLGRLGNAVVPQIAEWIGRRILEFERRVA